MGELEIRSSADEARREPGFLDLTGREIGRYRIQQRLGRSGVTTVYQAYDIVDDVPVALKVLLHGSDAKLYNRFRHEAQTAAKLHHPHIVRTLRVGVTPGSDTAYIAMELVEGEDLAVLLSTRRRLSPEESCLLLEPIARALAYAHSQGIVHRDVKPSNILLRTVSGDVAESVVLDALDYPVVPLLGDFGIARALDLPELTSWGRTVGTPAFMAPEQARGARNVDHRADLYALGAVFYRCITGHQPFIGTTVQILHAHVYESVTMSEEIQRHLSQRHIQILQRTLAKDPKDRYQSALELATDLARGVNPQTDELTAAEREAGITLTLELASVSEVTPPATNKLNVLIPAVGDGRTLAPTTSADPAQAAVSPTVTTTAVQQPLDPHFDPVLDQKLQKWSSIILSVLLTFLTVAVLFMLLRPLPRVLREMVVPPTPSLQATGAAVTGGAVTAARVSGRGLSSDAATNQRFAVATAAALAMATAAVPPSSTTAPAAHGAAPSPIAPRNTAAPVVASVATVVLLPHGELAVPTMAAPTAVNADAALPTVVVNGNEAESSNEQDTDLTYASCQLETAAELRGYISDLPAALRISFRCATEDPNHLQGEFLSYERGSMLYLYEPGKMLVSYVGVYNGVASPWEDFNVAWRAADPAGEPTPPVAPEELRFYPARMFATIWQTGVVRERLGMATTPQPEPISVVMQRFNQGLLVLRLPLSEQERATLYIYPLAARIF